MKTYRAEAQREGKWWVFRVPELQTGGQARTLHELDDEIKDVIALWLNHDAADFAVELRVIGDEDVLSKWTAAELEDAQARERQRDAAAKRRDVVHALRARGYSAPDVGRVLGISKQRVYQLEAKRSA